MNKIYRLVFALGLFFAGPAAAATPDADVAAAQAYLNGITTFKSRFIQTTGDGRQVAGDFFLSRPGRMRFEYDKPIEDFIVADGMFIYYYDGQMKQQSNALISQSLADFFLRKELSLAGDIAVSDVRRADGLLQMALAQAADPAAGSLTLFFSEKPLQLRKWRIVDAQGAVTVVELFEVETGVRLKDKLFKYYDPQHGEERFN